MQDAELRLEEVRVLQPVTYNWTGTAKSALDFIADRVAAVIPQALRHDEGSKFASFRPNTITATSGTAV